mgnify:CR=1 FL=1
MVMFKVKRTQDLHSILISLTDHWSDKKIATCSQVTISFQNTRSIKPNGISVSHIFDLNAEKHSPASSVQSTKRWVRGMLMSVGVESSHWQVAKRLRSWASSEADCECPLYDYSLYSKKDFISDKNQIRNLFYDSDYYLTKSSKSPASIAKSNKQWVGLACIRRSANSFW